MNNEKLATLMFALMFSLSGCQESECGDGVLEGEEECDGKQLSKTCQDFGFVQGEPTCDELTCKINTITCKNSDIECGNGFIEGNEQCDGQATNNATCPDGSPRSCDDSCSFVPCGNTPQPVCGNNIKEQGEQCDGNASDVCQDGSSRTCLPNCTLSACKDQPSSICGNDIKEQGEQCDGKDVPFETCPDGSLRSCTSSCTLKSCFCEPDPSFKGQMNGMRPDDGGNYVNNNATLPFDSGIKSANNYIRTKFKTFPDLFKDDIEFTIPTNEKFTITNGIIAATAFGGFAYVQDQNEILFIRFPQGYNLKDKNGNDVTFKVGQKVSFTGSKLVIFGGTIPQVSAIENLEIKNENNDVWVQELSGQDISPEKWGQIIRLGGKITRFDGGCGGDKKCYEVSHGRSEDKKITLRTNSNFLDKDSVGDCITWVGPLSSFPGPLHDGTINLQLNTDNYGWLRLPFKEL